MHAKNRARSLLSSMCILCAVFACLLLTRKLKMNNTKILGNNGEDVACEYLENKGYQILARNFVAKTGEVDIIARDGDCVVLVEVKTKKSAYFTDPWVNVNKVKMGKIWKTGQIYLLQTGLIDYPIRVDVVSVILPSDLEGGSQIEHFENILEG
jgi:putative endonuclease